MVPESLDSAHGLYAIGAIILIIGIVGAVAGSLIKRRLEEASRDERYVREQRGEEVARSNRRGSPTSCSTPASRSAGSGSSS